jgi:type II secretion system protein N
MMAEAQAAPLFGLSGFRRVLVIAAAAVALTSFFLIAGFPYDRLAPRAEAAIEAATGTRVSIGELGLVFTWVTPQVKAKDVAVTWPSGQQASFESVRVRPAWSTSWLRGAPALVVGLRSQLGQLDGTVTAGATPAFDGEIRNVSLALLPLENVAPGVQIEGRADAKIDLEMAEAGAQGTVHFDAQAGSLTLPLLPIGIPFEKLSGDVTLGGETLAKLDGFDLSGPLVGLQASGTIGQSPALHLAPLALHARIEAREPAVRSMLQSQGVALDANGSAAVEIGGTIGNPQIVPARGPGRAG